MDAAPLTNATTARVLSAVERFGKLRLATRAEVAESVLRNAGRDGWNPTIETLRKLEIAASELELEDGDAGADAHRESGAPILKAVRS